MPSKKPTLTTPISVNEVHAWSVKDAEFTKKRFVACALHLDDLRREHPDESYREMRLRWRSGSF